MNLYLDLNKAVQIPNTATDSVPGRQGVRQYNESFDQRSSGVDSEPNDKDNEESPNNEGSLDDTLEDDRKLDTQVAQERGIVEKPDAKAAKKSSEASDMLKSFTASLQQQLGYARPNEREIEYLTSECDYSRDDVIKGRARITGSERNRFNTWLQGEFEKSIKRLAR